MQIQIMKLGQNAKTTGTNTTTSGAYYTVKIMPCNRWSVDIGIRHHPSITVDIVTLVVLELSSLARKIECGLNNFEVTVFTLKLDLTVQVHVCAIDAFLTHI